MPTHFKFYLSFFCTGLLLFLGIAALNWQVDPLELFQHGEALKKPKLFDYQRLVKASALIRQEPEGLLLGSSRMLQGMQTADLEKLTGIAWYNLALSGASMREVRAYFDYALIPPHRVKQVIIGLDLFSFNEHRPPRPDFCEQRLQEKRLCLKDLISALLSFDALCGSVKTLFARDGSYIALDAHGNACPKSIDALAEKVGRSRQLRDKLSLEGYFRDADVYGSFVLSEAAIADFAALVQRANEEGIEVAAFFSPCQQQYWDALKTAYLDKEMAELTKRLEAILPLAHFLNEPFIASGTDTDYFDVAHYRPSIGKMLAEEIIRTRSAPNAAKK